MTSAIAIPVLALIYAVGRSPAGGLLKLAPEAENAEAPEKIR
jgi:hypothetical protein